MAVFSLVFSTLVACVAYIAYYAFSDVNTSLIAQPDKKYDFIIVGAGTAGCVLAARLTEDPKVKVLLVEAGESMGYFTKIPLTPTAAQLGPNDWSVRTTPQKYSSFGLWDQSQILPRGKGLGGSGQINFLLHGFGLPEDYERWSRLGFEGWSFQDLKPFFEKAFGTSKNEFDSSHCSVSGDCPWTKAPMKLRINEVSELAEAFKQASSRLANKHTMFKKTTATVVDGSRLSTFDAYLKPVLNRANLHVLLNTQGISIRFENKTAISLYILQNHRKLNNIFFKKEIILCAGAIKTPQLLMLSGIGPAELVKKLRVQLVSDNEHVGANLHDHMNMPVYVSVRKPVSITLGKVFTVSTLLEYYWRGSGVLSFPPVAGVEYQDHSALMLFSMGTASERLLRDLSNYKPQVVQVFRDTFPFSSDSSKEGFMFLATCSQPRSRGRVSLLDSSTSVPPRVDPNYLQHPHDLQCMLKAMRRAERLVASRPFKELGARIHWPRLERCLTFWNYTRQEQLGIIQAKRRKVTPPLYKPPPVKRARPRVEPAKVVKVQSPPDAYLECVVREVAVTGHHAGGTAAGGTVLDNQLRVREVSGVRVADASVFPAPTSLFPNSALVGLAERAAHIISQQHSLT